MRPNSKQKIKYYVVKRGRKLGIYLDWQEAELQIKGFSGATICSFINKKEAEMYIRKVDEHDMSSTNELQSRVDQENGAKAEVSTRKLNNPTVSEVKDTLEEYITIDEISTFDELEKTVKNHLKRRKESQFDNMWKYLDIIMDMLSDDGAKIKRLED